MVSVNDQTIVVTGASGGIGSAIALALAERGASVCLCGRDAEKLAEIGKGMSRQHVYPADLSDDRQLEMLVQSIQKENPRIDGLIHGAAAIVLGEVAKAPVDEFERQFKINVLVPFRLTQLLLPQLIEAQGQVVFINSSAGLSGKPNVRPARNSLTGRPSTRA